VKDLDLVAGEVRIERAWKRRAKSVSTPKTDESVRTVSIPAALTPLLERIARERKADDLVCPVVAGTNAKTHPTLYRGFLIASGIDAPGYFVETATHLMIDFRSMRDSGITWRFLAGERADVVQRESGHEHISTTLGYAKEVQDRDRRGRYGEPFPPLPSSLLESTTQDIRRLAAVSAAESAPPSGPVSRGGSRGSSPELPPKG